MVIRRFRRLKLIRNKYLALAVIVLVVAVGLIVALAHHKTNEQIAATHPNKPASRTNTSSGSQKETSPSGGFSASNTSANSGTSDQATTSGSLLAPSGQFVSNHHPGQNGSPTTETSVCNTTPGATCYIKFTMGSETKALDTSTADSNGTVIWNWDVKDVGFSSGSWQITAVASLNGETKTAADSQALVIE